MKKINIIGLVLVLLFTRNPWVAGQRGHSDRGTFIPPQKKPARSYEGASKAHANSNSIFGPRIPVKRIQPDKNMNDQDTKSRNQENRELQYEINTASRKYKK